MDDEPSDVGTTRPPDAPPRPDPEADKVARDVEFTLFYQDELASLIGFLMVYGVRSTAVADVAQEAMTEAYRSWDSIYSPRGWVRKVAVRNWLRRRDREQTEIAHDELPERKPVLSPSEAEEIENRHIFLALLGSLPPGQREVMAYAYDDFRPTEIAELAGKPPGTVRATLRDARASLKRRYTSPAEDKP